MICFWKIDSFSRLADDDIFQWWKQDMPTMSFYLIIFSFIFGIRQLWEMMGTRQGTVKPRPGAHMDMILFEVFLKSIDLIPQQQILQRHYLYYR